jgi:hypothetical protein
MIPLHHLAERPDETFADALEARLARIVAEPSTKEVGPIMAIDLEDDRTVTLGPSRRPRWLLAAAAVLVLIIAGTAVARRDGGSTSSTVGPNPKSVKFTIDFNGDEPSSNNTSSDRTFMRLFSSKTPGKVTGDVTGNVEVVFVVDSGPGYPRGRYQASDGRNHSVGVGTFNIDGSIAGCGTGTLMITEILDDSYDGTSTSGNRNGGTWQVVPGASTENLQHVTGSGAVDGGAFGQDLTGSISCG